MGERRHGSRTLLGDVERVDMTSDFEISLVTSASGNCPFSFGPSRKGIDHLRTRDDLIGILGSSR